MKRKLITRNNRKMTYWMKNKIIYILRRDPTFNYYKLYHKFISTELHSRAYRRNKFSKMINVPIEITSRNRNSRIRNKEVGSRVFNNIEQFNEHYGLNLVLEDLPTKY